MSASPAERKRIQINPSKGCSISSSETCKCSRAKISTPPAVSRCERAEPNTIQPDFWGNSW
eukprot:4107959-Karenia_brevis.AAC.1